MANPSVSVIVPVYNAAKSIERCLRSLLCQSLREIEILAVDDGSTDGSLQIMQALAAEDGRITVLRCCHAGVSQARNIGLDAAHGEYVGFADSDDFADSMMYESLLAPHADVAFCGYISEFVNHSDTKLFGIPDQTVFDGAKKRSLLCKMIGPGGEERLLPERLDFLSSIWNMVYRRELIEKAGARFIGLEEIGSCEDLLFNLAVFSRCEQAVYIDGAFYHYSRVNPESVTARYRPQLPEKWRTLYLLIGRFSHNAGLGGPGAEALQNRIGLNILNLAFNAISNPRRDKIRREISRILHDSVYSGAARRLNRHLLPLRWRPFYFFARHRMTGAVYISARLINRLRIRLHEIH